MVASFRLLFDSLLVSIGAKNDDVEHIAGDVLVLAIALTVRLPVGGLVQLLVAASINLPVVS